MAPISAAVALDSDVGLSMTDLLKPPNTRGDGWSKVRLIETAKWSETGSRQVIVKTQQRYYCRPLWNGLRKTPLVRRELRALKQLRKIGVAVPEVLHYSQDQTEATLVTAFIKEAQSLDVAWRTRPGQHKAILAEVAQLIAQLHRARWVHGALYPAHILITQSEARPPGPHAQLIDLEKAKYLGNRQADLDRLFRHAKFLDDPQRSYFSRVYESAMAGKWPKDAVEHESTPTGRRNRT